MEQKEKSCLNCLYFKTRRLTAKTLNRHSKFGAEDDLVGLYAFPVSVNVIKQVDTVGECRIFYCLNGRLARDVYMDSPRVEITAKRAGKCKLYDSMC